MRALAVETATSRQSVALLENDAVVQRRDRDAGGKHGQSLLPVIDELLERTGWALTDLDLLIVSIGPGSFTGLRVGLATMMGFRLVTGVPVVAVPTLEGMAWNLCTESGLLCPVLKARSGEVYWAIYEWIGARLTEISPAQVGSLRSFAESLPPSVTVFGDGWNVNRDSLLSLLDEVGQRGVHEVSGEQGEANAVSVALAGLGKFTRGETAGQVLSPLYVQRAEAEVKMGIQREAGRTTTV